MTKFPQHDWSAIRAFYREAEVDILEAGRSEWGIDAYMWDGLIRLTPIEYWLWCDIRACSGVFYPQYPVGRYFVDFANPAAKVAIECDGAEFHTDKAKDAARDADLECMGWTVYRAPGWLCATDSDDETGKPGKCYEFVRRICDTHRTSRNYIRKSKDPQSNDLVAELAHLFSREAAIKNAANRAAKLGKVW